MQVDDAERGFSYSRTASSTCAWIASRGRSAADILATITSEELIGQLQALGDEPQAERIAMAIVRVREQAPITTTKQLAASFRRRRSKKVGGCIRRRQVDHPSGSAHVPGLRILVNRELAKPGASAAADPAVSRRQGPCSHHQLPQRRGSAREGSFRAGTFEEVAADPIRASWDERNGNPRAEVAKLRLGARAP